MTAREIKRRDEAARAYAESHESASPMEAFIAGHDYADSILMPSLRAKDKVGKRYGHLVVLEATTMKTKHGQMVYKCRCDCGTEWLVASNNLRKGGTTSCGCTHPKYQKGWGERVKRKINEYKHQ